jgi:hypothetical protein
MFFQLVHKKMMDDTMGCLADTAMCAVHVVGWASTSEVKNLIFCLLFHIGTISALERTLGRTPTNKR